MSDLCSRSKAVKNIDLEAPVLPDISHDHGNMFSSNNPTQIQAGPWRSLSSLIFVTRTMMPCFQALAPQRLQPRGPLDDSLVAFSFSLDRSDVLQRLLSCRPEAHGCITNKMLKMQDGHNMRHVLKILCKFVELVDQTEYST